MENQQENLEEHDDVAQPQETQLAAQPTYDTASPEQSIPGETSDNVHQLQASPTMSSPKQDGGQAPTVPEPVPVEEIDQPQSHVPEIQPAQPQLSQQETETPPLVHTPPMDQTQSQTAMRIDMAGTKTTFQKADNQPQLQATTVEDANIEITAAQTGTPAPAQSPVHPQTTESVAPSPNTAQNPSHTLAIPRVSPVPKAMSSPVHPEVMQQVAPPPNTTPSPVHTPAMQTVPAAPITNPSPVHPSTIPTVPSPNATQYLINASGTQPAATNTTQIPVSTPVIQPVAPPATTQPAVPPTNALQSPIQAPAAQPVAPVHNATLPPGGPTDLPLTVPTPAPQVSTLATGQQQQVSNGDDSPEIISGMVEKDKTTTEAGSKGDPPGWSVPNQWAQQQLGFLRMQEQKHLSTKQKEAIEATQIKPPMVVKEPAPDDDYNWCPPMPPSQTAKYRRSREAQLVFETTIPTRSWSIEEDDKGDEDDNEMDIAAKSWIPHAPASDEHPAYTAAGPVAEIEIGSVVEEEFLEDETMDDEFILDDDEEVLEEEVLEEDDEVEIIDEETFDGEEILIEDDDEEEVTDDDDDEEIIEDDEEETIEEEEEEVIEEEVSATASFSDAFPAFEPPPLPTKPKKEKKHKKEKKQKKEKKAKKDKKQNKKARDRDGNQMGQDANLLFGGSFTDNQFDAYRPPPQRVAPAHPPQFRPPPAAVEESSGTSSSSSTTVIYVYEDDKVVDVLESQKDFVSVDDDFAFVDERGVFAPTAGALGILFLTVVLVAMGLGFGLFFAVQ